jgi:uncharacterized BrkB/YihY/UPF0761 family membrane protein
MNQITAFPAIAGLVAIIAALYNAAKNDRLKKYSWIVPALFSCFFLALSLQAVLTEGLMGFWPEHTRNLWGNQIWYDLLLAVVAALYFGIPEAKKVGMRVIPWTLLVLATGSIGLYAFIARLMFLKSRQAA